MLICLFFIPITQSKDWFQYSKTNKTNGSESMDVESDSSQEDVFPVVCLNWQ